jgi:hypothetical protein
MLPESSSTNITLGDTELVVEDARGDDASAIEAANAGSGSARLVVKTRLNKWMTYERACGWLFMIAS